MASLIGIMGQSGSGKTTSLRKMDPASTFIIDADRKGLSWAGWKRDYVEGKNYLRESNPAKVRAALESVSKKLPHIKAVVIDTVNSIMIDEEMRRMKEKGYDKWADLAQSVYELISEANVLRDDLVIVWVFHCEICEDELGGNRLVRFQTNGRKLQKINLEAKFPTVLFAQVKGDGEYVFTTQARQSVAKSPLGMFDTLEIPNDLRLVIDRVRAFESEGGELQSVGTSELTKDAVQPVSREEQFKEHDAKLGKLIDLQRCDGIANYDLLKYLKVKGMFDGKTLPEMPLDLIDAVCQPENWAKVVANINGEKTQAKEKKPVTPAPVEEPKKDADVFDIVIAVREKLKEAKLSDNQLTGFLIGKGMIDAGKAWFEGEESLLRAMIEPKNWSNVVLKITRMPF